MACPATGANRDLAYVREIVFKTTPATPFFKYLRTTGDSLKGTTEVQTSSELRKGRATSAPVKGKSSSAGDIPVELSYRSFHDFMAGLMYTRWTPDTQATYQDVDVLTATRAAVPGQMRLRLGQYVSSFSVMRRFSDKGLYRFYRGCLVGGFNLSVPLDGKITGSFNLTGVNNPRVLDEAIPAELATINAMGITYDPETPHNTDQFNSFVGTLKTIRATSVVTGEDIGYATQLDLSVTNNLNADYALFDMEAICVSPQQFGVTGTLTLYLIDGKHINDFIDWNTLKLVFVLEDPRGNMYQWTLPTIKLTDAPDGVSGPGSMTVAYPFTSFGENALEIIAIPSTLEHRALMPVLTATPTGFTLANHPDYTMADAWDLIYLNAIPAGYAREYSLNAGVTWLPYTIPVVLATGSHEVQFRATATAPIATSAVGLATVVIA